MSKIINPHDKFFTTSFDRPGVGKDFLKNNLPADIANLIDYNSVELTRDSFVDKKLKDYYSDKLLKARLKNGTQSLFYALIEHKSYPEPFVSFQLLVYKVKIWESFINEYNDIREIRKRQKKQGVCVGAIPPPLKHLPPIMPIVLYHGARNWTIPKNFRILIDPNRPVELDKYIPDFQYELVDLSGISEESIKGEIIYRVAMILMKNIFSKDLKNSLPDILKPLENLSNQNTASQYFETIVEYLLNCPISLTQQELENIVYSTFSENIRGDIMLTIADKLRNEGKIKGKKEGKKEGKIETALNMLKKGFDFNLIKEITGLPDKDLQAAFAVV